MALKGDAKAAWRRKDRLKKRMEEDMAKLNWERARARGRGERDYNEADAAGRHLSNAADAMLGEITDSYCGVTPDATGYTQLQQIATRKGYKPGWAAHQFKRRFGHFPWES